MASSARSVAGSRIASRCGYSALRWPLRLSIQAWSVGVPGRPKCWAIAHSAMNSRVEPEVICGPLSETASRIGRAGRHRRVGSTGRSWRASMEVEEAFGIQCVGEDELDLGGGLLRRDDLGDPLARDQVLDDEHRHTCAR